MSSEFVEDYGTDTKSPQRTTELKGATNGKAPALGWQPGLWFARVPCEQPERAARTPLRLNDQEKVKRHPAEAVGFVI
jgi:hypothetical protein